MPGLSRESLDAAISAEERERREESATRRQLKRAQALVAELERKVDLLTALDGLEAAPAEWAQPPKTRREHRTVANLMLSDLHLDEVVKPEQVGFRNAYDRRIAQLRLEATVARTIRMSREFITGLRYDGLYVWWNGDSVSGNIHDELRHTSSGQDVIDTIDYWSDHVAGAFSALADHFGRVRVVVSYGNHGRSTKRPESKDAVRSSYDWLLARIVYRALKADERITWNIPESLMVREQVYGTIYHLEHGDNFQGGDQIAGPVRPVMMGYYRRLAQGEPFDVMLTGHFHSYRALPEAVMNGSLVGYSEHSVRRGYRFEPPKQAFWLTLPEHGPSFHVPILPCDPKLEGWLS
jgi:hypothetical protein